MKITSIYIRFPQVKSTVLIGKQNNDTHEQETLPV